VGPGDYGILFADRCFLVGLYASAAGGGADVHCRILWGAENQRRAAADVADEAAAARNVLGRDAGPPLRDDNSQTQTKQPKETIPHAVLLLRRRLQLIPATYTRQEVSDRICRIVLQDGHDFFRFH